MLALHLLVARLLDHLDSRPLDHHPRTLRLRVKSDESSREPKVSARYKQRLSRRRSDLVPRVGHGSAACRRRLWLSVLVRESWLASWCPLVTVSLVQLVDGAILKSFHSVLLATQMLSITMRLGQRTWTARV